MGSGYRRQHEFIGYYGSFQGTTESDVWKVDRDAVSDYEHPTQKPIELVHRAFKNSTCRGDVVFDPFGGSGTTYAVAERMHRQWIGIELGDTDPIVARLTGEMFEVEAPNRGDAGKGMSRVEPTTQEPGRPSLF